jgi:hypothetical protein
MVFGLTKQDFVLLNVAKCGPKNIFVALHKKLNSDSGPEFPYAGTTMGCELKRNNDRFVLHNSVQRSIERHDVNEHVWR